MTTVAPISLAGRLRSGLAAALVAAFAAGAAAPASAVGVTAADDFGLYQLGNGYGSSSFRHHFYRNVPNKGLSYGDHEAFRGARGDRFMAEPL